MKYHDLLHAYKTGEITEELKKQIENDIEKQEAISDYLVDQMEESWDEGHQEIEPALELKNDAADLTKQINRSIHRAFWKMGMIVTAISLAVILFVSFGLSPLVSSFYYDPSKIVIENKEYETTMNQISLDYMIYSDMTMPGYCRDVVNVEPQGYGKYSIEICQTLSTNDQFTNVGGYINKGKLTLYNSNLLKKPFTGVFAGFNLSGEGTLTERVAKETADAQLAENEQLGYWFYPTQDDARAALHELKDDEDYYGYVTFDKEMTFQELQDFIKKLPDNTGCVWCGVRTADYGNGGQLGYFQKNFSSNIYDLTEYPELNEKYPNLDVYASDRSGGIKDSDVIEQHLQDEDWCQTHMLSMLKYLTDQTEFLEMMGEEKSTYLNAAEYIASNGFTFYGIVVASNKADLLQLEKMDEVYGIYTEKMK